MFDAGDFAVQEARAARERAQAVIEHAATQPYEFEFNSARVRKAKADVALVDSWLSPPTLSSYSVQEISDAVESLRDVQRRADMGVNLPILKALFRPGYANVARALISGAPGDDLADQVARGMRDWFAPTHGTGKDAVRWAIRYGERLLETRKQEAA